MIAEVAKTNILDTQPPVVRCSSGGASVFGWAYLYRAVDSAGETIEFMLSPKRDLIAAKLFLRLALSGGVPRPRVINVDGHPAYASAIAELKQTGELGRHCRCRTAPYLKNVIEQDHRFIKKRITASLGFRSAEGACRTIEGYEAMQSAKVRSDGWPRAGNASSSITSSASLHSSHRHAHRRLSALAICNRTFVRRPKLDQCCRFLLIH